MTTLTIVGAMQGTHLEREHPFPLESHIRIQQLIEAAQGERCANQQYAGQRDLERDESFPEIEPAGRSRRRVSGGA
jgi:hypothetical protein